MYANHAFFKVYVAIRKIIEDETFIEQVFIPICRLGCMELLCRCRICWSLCWFEWGWMAILAGVVCAFMRIYSIHFDRIRKKSDLGKVFLTYDFDTGAVFPVPEEPVRKVIDYLSGKGTKYLVLTFLRFRGCAVIILYHRRCRIMRKRWSSTNYDTGY